jgi:hypothetical protein
MSEKLFKPIHIEEIHLFDKPKVSEEDQFVFPSLSTFKGVLGEMKKEIVRLQEGTSELRRGAIYFPKGNVLPLNAIVRFERNPDQKSLNNLFDICAQDLGTRVHDHFVDLFRGVFPDCQRRKGTE